MADSKLRDLTAASSLALTDLFYVLIDPSGSPLDRKGTFTQLVTLLQTSAKLPQIVVANSDESVANDTIQNDDELFFTAVANGVYYFDLSLMFNCGASNTPDVKVGITLPSGTITNWNIAFPTGTTSNVNTALTDVILHNVGYQQAAVGPLSRGVLTTAVMSNTPVSIRGIIRVGVTGGTVQVTFAQAVTTGGNPVIRKTDSFLAYTRIS